MKREDVKTKDQARNYALQRAQEEIEELMKAKEEVSKGKEWEEDQENLREPLNIEASHRVTIQLSWGGDGDGFILEYNRDGELMSGLYYWEDWGYYEEVRLTQKEAELVEEVYLGGDGLSYLLIGGLK